MTEVNPVTLRSPSMENLLHSQHDSRSARQIMAYLRAVVTRRWTLSEEAADDLIQATWLRVLERGSAFRGQSAFSTYAVGVAINVRREQARRELRRRAMESRMEVEHAIGSLVHEASPADVAIGQRQGVDKVRAALAVLEPRERWLIHARFVEEASYDELLPRFQSVFGSSIRTAEGLRCVVHKAKRRLHDLLCSAQGPGPGMRSPNGPGPVRRGRPLT